jgi:hypothetical protein
MAAAFMRVCTELRRDGVRGENDPLERWAVNRLPQLRACCTRLACRTSGCRRLGSIPITVEKEWGKLDPLEAVIGARTALTEPGDLPGLVLVT